MKIVLVEPQSKEIDIRMTFEDLLLIAEEFETMGKDPKERQGDFEPKAHQLLYHYLNIMETIKLRNSGSFEE